MGVISYLLTLVLIYGLLVSNFGYMGDASRDASMLSSWDKVTTHDFSHKLKVVSHKVAHFDFYSVWTLAFVKRVWGKSEKNSQLVLHL